MLKKLLVIALALVLACPAVLAAAETTVFTDSLGREITVDRDIRRVAVAGPSAQIVVFALAPDQLVGLSRAWEHPAEDFLDERYLNLPVLGQLHGGRGGINLEALLALSPQVIIDVGEAKADMAQELDDLQAQTGVPVVFIEEHLDAMDETYRMLGTLLGREEQAETLAACCADLYGRVLAIAQGVEKAGILYVLGADGLSVVAKGAYHAELIDLLSDNLAVVETPSSRGTGNEVDMEQILAWNPEKIIFAPDSIYDTVWDRPEWQSVKAVQNGDCYEAPMGPCNWMGFPPSAQRLLGMLWMTKTLYPEAADYDLYAEVARYFDLFYHCPITKAQFDGLTAHSVRRG